MALNRYGQPVCGKFSRMNLQFQFSEENHKKKHIHSFSFQHWKLAQFLYIQNGMIYRDSWFTIINFYIRESCLNEDCPRQWEQQVQRLQGRKTQNIGAKK